MKKTLLLSLCIISYNTAWTSAVKSKHIGIIVENDSQKSKLIITAWNAMKEGARLTTDSFEGTSTYEDITYGDNGTSTSTTAIDNTTPLFEAIKKIHKHIYGNEGKVAQTHKLIYGHTTSEWGLAYGISPSLARLTVHDVVAILPKK